jgi:hypothetical protein
MTHTSGMSYSSGSAADRLQAVREAIDRCLQAEMYSVRGRSKQSAKLEALIKLEERLTQEAATETDGGAMSSVGRYMRPS